jgi:hypothetical protein
MVLEIAKAPGAAIIEATTKWLAGTLKLMYAAKVEPATFRIYIYILVVMQSLSRSVIDLAPKSQSINRAVGAKKRRYKRFFLQPISSNNDSTTAPSQPTSYK